MKQVTRQAAEAIINEHVKPVFGFAMKRCATLQDAEDLAQDILCKAYRALILRDDVENPAKFLWTIAHHALSNHYRAAAKFAIGVPLEDAGELAGAQDVAADVESREAVSRLQQEIAYLSGMQRRIVIAYWFEGRRQADIARMLGVPEGTVKWHLFEAKKELKRGIQKMRQASELKFNPVHFTSVSINGSNGASTPADKIHAVIAQNICYCVRDSWKTIHQIADNLGVSPVYVEDEVNRLEEYGLLQMKCDRYIANFIISEPTQALLAARDSMYKQAAALIAGDLYDELTASCILSAPDIRCEQPDNRANFLLWTLIPYIAARSGKDQQAWDISFDEVATIRPDGGHNTVEAEILPEEKPEGYLTMQNLCGPMWNGVDNRILWQIDSEWCSREHPGVFYAEESRRVLSLYEREKTERLSRDEYAWLAERGFVKLSGDYDGLFHSSWQVVILNGEDIEARLLAIGKKVKARHAAELAALKTPFAALELAQTPAHLRKIREFEHQYIFHDDGWFLLHCLTWLVESGRLQLPTQAQRRSLITLILDK